MTKSKPPRQIQAIEGQLRALPHDPQGDLSIHLNLNDGYLLASNEGGHIEIYCADVKDLKIIYLGTAKEVRFIVGPLSASLTAKNGVMVEIEDTEVLSRLASSCPIDTRRPDKRPSIAARPRSYTTLIHRHLGLAPKRPA